MLVGRVPLSLYAFTAAVVGGVLLAVGSYLAGGILAGVAIVLATARYIADARGEDDTTAPPM
jgi:branched-subunit amino acid ABC-type transport system permease component